MQNINQFISRINKKKSNIFIKILWAICLLPFLFVYSCYQAFTLLFLNPFKSFNNSAKKEENGVYQTSYQEHLKLKSRTRLFSLSTITLVIISVLAVNIITTAFFDSQGVSPVFASTTVSCSGTSGSPTAIDEASLNGLDVIFTNGGGSGWCGLDAPITAASVVVNTGVTITHTAADADGITITTTGNFEIQNGAYINTNSKGCQSAGSADGYGPNGSNVCTISTAGYGDGVDAVNRGLQGAGYGGTGGLGSTSESAGGATYGDPTAPIFLGSSGGHTGAAAGGLGGGLVHLTVSGTFTNNGTISANGSAGSAGAGTGNGGGSGGSIYIAANSVAGTTGTFSSNGGAGGSSTGYGGGGAGGRIAIAYTSLTFSFDSTDFAVTGGAKGGGTAQNGSLGTVYVKDTDDNAVTIYYGFDYATDISETTWTVDSSATGQYCSGADSTPSLTATTITLRGTLTCTHSSITGFDVTPSSSLTMDGFTFNLGAIDFFTINDAIPVLLTNSTTINANVQWTNLASLQIDNGSSVSANSKGCQGAYRGNFDGYSPDSSNVCAQGSTGGRLGWGDGADDWAGLQGGGHGGAGGVGSTSGYNTGGATYDSATAPVLFGSSGGTANYITSGHGGGLIRLSVSGNFLHNGALSVDGGVGNGNADFASGGGSGGSIYITTGSISGTTGEFSADGGAGYNGTRDGGGGGGGRIAFEYGADSTTYLAGLSAVTVVVGGLGPDTAADGVVGTLSKVQTVYLASIAITDNSGYTNDSTPVITITESGATPTHVAFSCNAGSNWSDWIAYPDDDAVNDGDGPAFDITSGATGCSVTNELKTISAKIKDASSTSSTVSDTTTYDTASPTVSNVTSTNDNGTYDAEDVITVTVQFDSSMAVTGTPQLLLDMNGTDRQANFSSVLTNTLSFTYTIINGDNKTDLDYVGTDSLALNSGTIKDLAGNSATLTLAAPGAAGSLGANKAINIVTNPEVNWSAASQSGAENIGTMTITANLSFAYPSDVTIPYTYAAGTAAETSDFTIAASPLIITAGKTAGKITITVVDDYLDESNETVIVTMGSPTNGIKGATDIHTATITDNDTDGVTVAQSGGSTNVSEGGVTDTYTIVLNAAPDANVVMTATDDDQVNISPTVLTFTPINWGSAQTIIVSSQRDTNNSEGLHTGAITHTATSSDVNYNAISISEVIANITDNQLPVANAGADQTVNETESVSLNSSASTDADGDALTATWMEITDSGDGCSQTGTTVATLNKESNYACGYRLIVNDGYIDSSADTVTINVTADNDSPAIGSIADVTVNENDTLVIAVSASDVDSSALTLTATDNPTGSTFTDNRNKSGNLTWVPTYEQAGNYDITFRASDGTNQTTESVAVTVNDVVTNSAPEFTGSLPNLAFYAGTSITPFDLDDYFIDTDGDVLTYAAVSNEQVEIVITDGQVTLSAPETFIGTEAVHFTAVDPIGEVATSNSIVITVSEFTEGNIGYLSGVSKGQGIITVYDKNNNLVSQWRAFPIGGVVPKLGTIDDQTYIFAVKSRTGTTMHVYTATGQIIAKKRLSSKCNWRRLAIGNLNNSKHDEEIAVVARRGKTLFIKIYSFNPATHHFKLLKRSVYKYLSEDYRVNIDNKKVLIIVNGEGKTIYRWQPF